MILSPFRSYNNNNNLFAQFIDVFAKYKVFVNINSEKANVPRSFNDIRTDCKWSSIIIIMWIDDQQLEFVQVDHKIVIVIPGQGFHGFYM